MTTLNLSKGKCTIVDDDVGEHILEKKWCVSGCGNSLYAVRRDPCTRKSIYLHRTIMDAAKGEIVDHINGDMLDNRRSNLRKCTKQQNCANQKVKSNISGAKGVTKHKKTGKWSARITVNFQNIHLGLFEDVDDAARAYDDAAIRYFGEFARTNEASH